MGTVGTINSGAYQRAVAAVPDDVPMRASRVRASSSS